MFFSSCILDVSPPSKVFETYLADNTRCKQTGVVLNKNDTSTNDSVCWSSPLPIVIIDTEGLDLTDGHQGWTFYDNSDDGIPAKMYILNDPFKVR